MKTLLEFIYKVGDANPYFSNDTADAELERLFPGHFAVSFQSRCYFIVASYLQSHTLTDEQTAWLEQAKSLGYILDYATREVVAP